MMQDGASAVHSDRLTGGSRMDGWGHKATAISRSRLVPSRPWFPWQRGGSAHFSMHNLTTKVGAAWQRKMSGPACCCRCSAVLLLFLASLHCHALAGLIAHTTGKRSQVDVISLAVTLIFHPSLAVNKAVRVRTAAPSPAQAAVHSQLHSIHPQQPRQGRQHRFALHRPASTDLSPGRR